jgi:hypothetical protein
VLDAAQDLWALRAMSFLMCENQNMAGIIGPKDPVSRSFLKTGPVQMVEQNCFE